MSLAWHIENFPGLDNGISGVELAEKMRRQAAACGAEIIEDQIKEIRPVAAKCMQASEKCRREFLLKTTGGKEYQALAVIVAAGAEARKLGVPGEDEFIGRGVSYCATCDAPLFKQKTVVVVGGGDTAVEEALFLAKYCKKVYLVHRRNRLRATKVLAERVAACKTIEPVWNSTLTQIIGDKKVAAVKISGQGPSSLECDGVFIFAGTSPNSGIVKDMVSTDKNGYIITDEDMRTSFEGIFACGDVRRKLLRQVVMACGEAATAAVSAQHYVESLKGTAYE